MCKPLGFLAAAIVFTVAVTTVIAVAAAVKTAQWVIEDAAKDCR